MHTLHQLGEYEIVKTIINVLDEMPDIPIPFGDDVSAIRIGHGRLAVFKTDMLVGRTDVPPGMSLWQAARKAVVMNVSDFAAKGVKPIAFLASVGFPRTFLKSDAEDVGRGLNAGAREYDAYVVGGDTNESSDLIISCTAIGLGSERALITRFGAKPGDILAVTGTFGETSSGLKILLEKLSAPTEIKEKLLEHVYLPKARLKEGLALARSGAATASIDSSDGLAISLHQLSSTSNVGSIVTDLPIPPEVERFANIHGLDPKELALYGGEEYELVVTIKPSLWEKACRIVERVGSTLIKIGKVTKEKKIILKMKGEEEEPIPFRGWEHFKK